MPSLCRAYKENRKLPFLKALARIGTIAGAARACRISRDAVHDWRHNDGAFEQLFEQARIRHQEARDHGMERAIEFFETVAHRVVPREYWARMAVELAIAVANLKNDLKGDRRRGRMPAASSGKPAELSLSPRQRSMDVAIPRRDNDSSAVDL